MNYAIVTDLGSMDDIDFIPTIIIGFYQYGEEDSFLKYSKILKERFANVDIIGCSSESNIHDSMPHIDIDNTHLCTYMCIDMKKESYALQLCKKDEEIAFMLDESKKYSAIVLNSTYDNYLEKIIAALHQKIGKNDFFGVIAGSVASKLDKVTIFYNGQYISEDALIWFIDQNDYALKGMSVHDFEPVGFSLEITSADAYTIYEIENKPALDMVEEIIGTLDPEALASFDHPFVITSDTENSSVQSPLASIHNIDRKVKSLTLFKKVYKGQKLKLAIPFDRKQQEEQLNKFCKYNTNNAIAFLFVCVAFKKHWGEMEPIYLMRLAENLKLPFIGLHALGEIGPLQEDGFSLMQNQTVTLAVLSEK